MPQRIAYRPLGLLALLSATLLCTHGPAWADRGSIRTEPVNIEEPAQRAIIVHSGVREWLILQTDVRAEKTTRIVEFMPLPAKPEVSLAPEGCFAALKDLVEKHKLRYGSSGRGVAAKGPGGPDESVQVVVSAQLGPHAITVAQAKDTDAFVGWVRQFFRKNDLGLPALTPELREVVADYLNRDLCFFAFDIITLSPEQQTVQPLTYEFHSDRLYYPLVVTNLYGGGQGTIELFTILPEYLNTINDSYLITLRPDPALAAGTWRELHAGGATVRADELAGLHSDLPKRLGNDQAYLGACKYEGTLRFEHDVFTPLGYREPRFLAKRFLAAWAAGDREVLDAFTGTPFVLADPNWQAVISDREKLLAELAATKPNAATNDLVAWPKFAREVPFREFADRFSRDFIIEQLQPGEDKIVVFTIDGLPGSYSVFVQQARDKFFKVVGLVIKE
jgi:hypothetical protein